MVTVGYNPTTHKAQYNASTGKQCEGCCDGTVIIEGCDCSFCSSDQRESYEVVISGYDACGDETWGDLTRTGAFSPNGRHVVNLVDECFYISENIVCAVEAYNSLSEITVYYSLWRISLTIESGSMSLVIEMEQSDHCDPVDGCCTTGKTTGACSVWDNGIWQEIATATLTGTCASPGVNGSLIISNDNCTPGIPEVFHMPIFEESAGGGDVDIELGDGRVCEDVV